MSKKHDYELLPGEMQDELREMHRKGVSECSKRYFDYCETQGIENSCHIPREHGPDISIMTEIVQKNHKLNLASTALFPFKESPDAELSSSSSSSGSSSSASDEDKNIVKDND